MSAPGAATQETQVLGNFKTSAFSHGCIHSIIYHSQADIIRMNMQIGTFTTRNTMYKVKEMLVYMLIYGCV